MAFILVTLYGVWTGVGVKLVPDSRRSQSGRDGSGLDHILNKAQQEVLQ